MARNTFSSGRIVLTLIAFTDVASQTYAVTLMTEDQASRLQVIVGHMMEDVAVEDPGALLLGHKLDVVAIARPGTPGITAVATMIPKCSVVRIFIGTFGLSDLQRN